jgi:hypothetical protein
VLDGSGVAEEVVECGGKGCAHGFELSLLLSDWMLGAGLLLSALASMIQVSHMR